MTECSPQFHPLSVPNNKEWESGEKEERRHGGEIEISLLGSKPLPAQRKALSLAPSPIHSLKQCSHWEPSWLDIIFSSYPLMIVAQCQKRPIVSNFSKPTSTFVQTALTKTLKGNHDLFMVKKKILIVPLSKINYKATVKQGNH